jgi:DNA adenine methylase
MGTAGDAIAHQVTASPLGPVSDSGALPPPLKWAGGKRWLLPYLEPLWQEHKHRRLVEPFCGGLAIALGLRPKRALLNDANPHLSNFYEQIRNGLKLTLGARNDEGIYYTHRERFNRLIRDGHAGTNEAAQLFYYLNRTGYNGLCRFNSSGGFNVPFGRYATINYVKDFEPYRELFNSWEFSTGDFENLRLRPTDFIYADPPYDVEFTTYSAGGFSWEDQQRAAEWLARHPGPVVLSNQATPRVVRLYKSLGFGLRYAAAPRRISCTGDRAPTAEVVAFKNLPRRPGAKQFAAPPRRTPAPRRADAPAR